ncbi:MAG: hypothetical protein ACI9SK_000932, partial [Zhongshania sp.]
VQAGAWVVQGDATLVADQTLTDANSVIDLATVTSDPTGTTSLVIVTSGPYEIPATADLSGFDTIVVSGTGTVTVANGANVAGVVWNVEANATLSLIGTQADGLSVTGTGAVDVSELENASAADLSNITATGTLTASTSTVIFTGNLGTFGQIEVIGTETLTVAAGIIDGLSITTGASGTAVITDLATNLAVDLSGVSVNASALFETSGTFTGDLGSVEVTIANGIAMTAAASILAGANVTKTGGGADDGAVVVTLSNTAADVGVDLTTLLSGAGDPADITSVTVLESLTFAGVLSVSPQVQVADGATLSLAADIIDGETVNVEGTTGAVAVDATIVTTAPLNLAGSAHYSVTALGANLAAPLVTGSLTVTLVDASLTIDLGAGANIIDADALTTGNLLTVTGQDTPVSISTTNGDVDASGVTDTDSVSTTGGVTLNGGVGSNILTGSANDDIINGGASADTLSGGDGDDIFVIDDALDVVGGEVINGDNGEDALSIQTADPVDLSQLLTLAAVETLDVSSVDAKVTVTGLQLNSFNPIIADSNDSLTIHTLNGLSVSATATAKDTFDFVTGGAATGVTIGNFGTSTDVFDLDETFATGTYAEGSVGNQSILGNYGVLVANEDLNGITTTDVESLLSTTTIDPNETFYFVADNGSDTFVFQVADSDGNGAFEAADNDAVLVATITGMTDALTLSTANFSDYV